MERKRNGRCGCADGASELDKLLGGDGNGLYALFPELGKWIRPDAVGEFSCFIVDILRRFMAKGYITEEDAMERFLTRDEYRDDFVSSVSAVGTPPLNLSVADGGGGEAVVHGGVDTVTETSAGLMSAQDKVDLDYLVSNVNVRLDEVGEVDDIVTGVSPAFILPTCVFDGIQEEHQVNGGNGTRVYFYWSHRLGGASSVSLDCVVDESGVEYSAETDTVGLSVVLPGTGSSYLGHEYHLRCLYAAGDGNTGTVLSVNVLVPRSGGDYYIE